MQHNAYTHGGTIGIGCNVNANDFPNNNGSNSSHVLNAIQTSLPHTNNNNNSHSSNIVATAVTTSSRGEETGVISPNELTSIGGSSGVGAVNYGATFFGNDYHHQLTQSALMANTTSYAAAASSAASTAMLTNYCDAAMMMAAAAVNANQCLQQQQQRMALMANCQTAFTGGNSSSNTDEHDVANLKKIPSPVNVNHSASQRSHNINPSVVSSALSSASSTTSSSSALLSSNSSSATTSPSITLVNTASLISANAEIAAGSHHPPISLHTQPQNHPLHHLHLHQQHHVEPPVTSPNLIDISEVPLIVDVK